MRVFRTGRDAAVFLWLNLIEMRGNYCIDKKSTENETLIVDTLCVSCAQTKFAI